MEWMIIILVFFRLVEADFGCHYFGNNNGVVQCFNTTLLDFIKFKKSHSISAVSILRITHCELSQLESAVFVTGWDNVNVTEIKNNIRNIDLSHNQIQDIAMFTFYNLNNVVMLNLGDNQIQFIQSEQFYGLRDSLVILNLSFNRIQELGNNLFSEFLNLRILYLNNNQIIKLAPSFLFRSGARLEELNLSYNKIRYLPETITKSLFKIQTLNISDNYLESFNFVFLNDSRIDYSKDFVPLGQLRNLYLNNNQLKDFNIEKLMYLPNLKNIRLERNRLRCDRHEQIQRDLINLKINVNNVDYSLTCVDKQLFQINESTYFEQRTRYIRMGLEFTLAVMLVLIPTIIVLYLVRYVIFLRIDQQDQFELRPF